MASRRAFVLLAIVSSFYGVRCNSSNISAQVEPTLSAGTVVASGPLQPSPTQSASQTPSPQQGHNNATVTQKVEPSATAHRPVPTTSSEGPTTANNSVITTGSTTPAPCRMTVKITFTVCNETWKAAYDEANSAEIHDFRLKSEIMMKDEIFPQSKYNVISVEIQNLENDGNKTRVTVTITFGPPKTPEILFEERLKKFDGKTTCMPACIKNIEIKVQDIEWKENDADCKMKCCDGSGGPFIIEKTCVAPSACVCNRVLKKKVEYDSCTAYHCECDSGISVTASFFLVLAAVIMASA